MIQRENEWFKFVSSQQLFVKTTMDKSNQFSELKASDFLEENPELQHGSLESQQELAKEAKPESREEVFETCSSGSFSPFPCSRGTQAAMRPIGTFESGEDFIKNIKIIPNERLAILTEENGLYFLTKTSSLVAAASPNPNGVPLYDAECISELEQRPETLLYASCSKDQSIVFKTQELISSPREPQSQSQKQVASIPLKVYGHECLETPMHLRTRDLDKKFLFFSGKKMLFGHIDLEKMTPSFSHLKTDSSSSSSVALSHLVRGSNGHFLGNSASECVFFDSRMDHRTPLRPLFKHGSGVNHLELIDTFSSEIRPAADGPKESSNGILSAGRDSNVILHWDLRKTRGPLGKYERPGTEKTKQRMIFGVSPSGLLIGDAFGRVHLFDTRTQMKLGVYQVAATTQSVNVIKTTRENPRKFIGSWGSRVFYEDIKQEKGTLFEITFQ